MSNSETLEVFLEKSGLSDWKLGNYDWGNPKNIDIPDLTVRERLYIDSKLPNANADDIQKDLGFTFAESERDHLWKCLRIYSDFYRFLPYFSRIAV